MLNEERLRNTTDARVWAAEWFAAYQRLGPMNGPDMVDWMTTWFANAIEIARDFQDQHELNQIKLQKRCGVYKGD